MKLLTQTLRNKLPKLGSQEKVEDPIVVAHFFNPTGIGDWYVLEGEPTGDVEDDFDFFGLVHLQETELGYFSLNELQEYKGRWGLGIERDLYWTPVPLSKVRAKHVS